MCYNLPPGRADDSKEINAGHGRSLDHKESKLDVQSNLLVRTTP